MYSSQQKEIAMRDRAHPPQKDLFSDKQSGASLVEFALLAPLLFLLVFAVIESAMLLWAHMTMQYAVREGLRYAVVDHGVYGADPAYGQVIQKIQDNAMGFYEVMKPVYQVTVNGVRTEYTSPGDFHGAMFGQRSDLVQMRINLQWPFMDPLFATLFNDSHYAFSVAATMRKEVS
jgi:Flp pilus assembly protein TadG